MLGQAPAAICGRENMGGGFAGFAHRRQAVTLAVITEDAGLVMNSDAAVRLFHQAARFVRPCVLHPWKGRGEGCRHNGYEQD